jgi:hypothetical protein
MENSLPIEVGGPLSLLVFHVTASHFHVSKRGHDLDMLTTLLHL